ncbi:hypothetical protein D910_05622, partial [Dendroctonus ponderosae]
MRPSAVTHFPNADDNQIFNISLNGDSSISLHWMIDYQQKVLSFEIHLPDKFGWFAFGFSDRGDSFPADYCLLWEKMCHYKSPCIFKDVWANDAGVIELDRHQDCNNFRFKIIRNVVKFTFKRKFDTCDNRDYIIQDGTTHIVWSRGLEHIVAPNGLNISTTIRENFGMIRVNLLKNLKAHSQLPSHVQVLDLLTDKVQVPNEETTYWCKVFKLPESFRRKHHIYQYEANIESTSQGLVHHMEIFHCETSAMEKIPLYNGNCFGEDRPEKTQVCKRVLAAWAMGAQPFTYPEEAALPLGGNKFNPYVMLEIHYNNPELKSGVIDSSGVRFYVSDKLKEMDAGVIELGLEYTDKMAIPPGQESFSLTGYCISSCTSVVGSSLEFLSPNWVLNVVSQGLHNEGITVFGSQLHTHLTGVRVHTRHFDAYGKELPELDRDNHY